MGAFNFLTQELAIDLGTANTLIIHRDKVVVDEPSIIAINRTTKEVIAIGKQAMMMHGKAQRRHQDHSPVEGWRNCRLYRSGTRDSRINPRWFVTGPKRCSAPICAW
jgi:molecular chaperone DnaK (HSP70)